MSAVNGDKARFHRVRKQRIHTRERNQKLLQTLGKQPTPAASQSDPKPKERLV